MTTTKTFDQLRKSLSRIQREKSRLLPVEPATQSRIDLPNVVFGNSVTFAREVIDIEQWRKRHTRGNLVHRPALVHGTYGLIPQELNRISITGCLLPNVFATRQGRPMGRNQVIRLPRDDVVDSRDQDAWVAILLTANGEDIEQHRPNRVVYTYAEIREKEVD